MAWRQQVQLLQHLSSTSSISDFGKYYDSVCQLCLKVQDWSRGSAEQDSPDSHLIKATLTACRSGFKALCEALKAKQRLDTETKLCISSLVGLMDNLLCNCVSGGLPRDPMTEAAAGGRKGPVGLAPVSVSEVQSLMTQTGFLDSLADLFSAITITFNQYLQSEKSSGPSCVDAALQLRTGDSKSKPNDPTAVSATAPLPLTFIKRLLALWLRLDHLSVAHGLCAALGGFGQTPSHGVSQGPYFQATLQEPLSSLLLALLRYEHCMGNDMSECMTTPDGKDIVYGVVCQVVLTVPTMPQLSQLSLMMFHPDDTSQRPKPAVDDSILQTPDVHALLLFMLAAVAQALHREQKGESPAVLLEPKPNPSSSGAHQKQQLQVADFSAAVLQGLGVCETQAQRLWMSLNQRGDYLAQPAKLQHDIDMVLEHLCSGLGQHSTQSSSSSSSSSTRRQPAMLLQHVGNSIMLLKLLIQLIALRPTAAEMSDNLNYMWTISSNIMRLHKVEGRDQDLSAMIKAALAEMTDSILAPFVLHVGPAVLHAFQQPDCSQGLQDDILKMWYHVLGIFQSVKLHYTGAHKSCYFEAVSTWSVILQQQPSTAVTAVEMALRAMPEEARGDMYTICLSLLLTSCSFMEAVSNDRERYVTAATLNGSSSQAQWHKDLVAKTISLLLTIAKLYTIVSINKKAAAVLFQGIVCAVKTASRMDMAISTKRDSTSLSSQKQAKEHPQAAASVSPASWLHAAARLLHCSSLAMQCLQEFRSGVVDITDKLTKEPDVLPVAVAWCNEQAKLLHSNNSSGSVTPAAANGDSGKGPYSEILKRLQLLNKELQQGFFSNKKSYDRLLALQLQQYAELLCSVFPTTLCCNNPSCSNVSGLSELDSVCTKCSNCQAAAYCSRECQVQHWSQHMKICGLL